MECDGFVNEVWDCWWNVLRLIEALGVSEVSAFQVERIQIDWDFERFLWWLQSE